MKVLRAAVYGVGSFFVGKRSRHASWRRLTPFALLILMLAAILPMPASAGGPWSTVATKAEALQGCQAYLDAQPNGPGDDTCDVTVDNGTDGVYTLGGHCCGAGNVWLWNTRLISPALNSGDGGLDDGGEGGKPCGCDKAAPLVADPINASTGNKYLHEDDYLGNPELTLRRFYNSGTVTAAAIGSHWRHSFDRALQILGRPPSSIVMTRPDGMQETFIKTSGAWSEVNAQLMPTGVDTLVEADDAQGLPIGYTIFIGALRHREVYSATGLLQAVIDATGQATSLTYTTAINQERISSQTA